MTTHSSSSFWQLPATQLGWYAVGLAVTFVLMYTIKSTVFMHVSENAPDAWWRRTRLPFYGIYMMLCGLAAGIMGLIAVIRKHERSCKVLLTILPGALVLFFCSGGVPGATLVLSVKQILPMSSLG